MREPFAHVLSTAEELEERYRAPSELVRNKGVDHLDAGCRRFIAAATFVLIGTSNHTGQDVSPKGGPAGFVKVLDGHRLVIPDMAGNNRIDGLRNIIDNPAVGLLFIVPGLGETLRVFGSACVTVDPAVLDLFATEVRRPTAAIGVTITEAFIHCAKAFRRGGIWDSELWPDDDDRPFAAEIVAGHVATEGITGAMVESALAASYSAAEVTDLPEPESDE